MNTLFATPIANAPPDEPSPITIEITGTFNLAISNIDFRLSRHLSPHRARFGRETGCCAPPEADFAKVKSASVAIGNRTV